MIQAAGRWFLHSGIQEASGGVARYYRSDLGQNARVSTEITGYAVSTLLFLYQRTGDSAYLEAALRAARFLTRVAWDREAWHVSVRAAGEGPASLTSSIAASSCADCCLRWRVTEDTEFARCGHCGRPRDAGRLPIGPWASIRFSRCREKQPLAWEPRWSASPGCYQLKSAMAWHELFEVTGEHEFCSGYESALQAALENDSAFLATEPDPLRIMDRLHAYAYFLEGLLPVLDRPECAVAFRNGVHRASLLLREIATVFARSDVYAQLLRVRLVGRALGVLALDEAEAAYEAEQAASFQIPRSTGRRIPLRPQARRSDMPFVNPVSTAFCVDRRSRTFGAHPTEHNAAEAACTFGNSIGSSPV